MGLQLNGAAVKSDIADRVGRTLLRMAVTVQAAMIRKVNTSNQRGTNPSLPGGWLHKGTGAGQGGLKYEPTSAAAVAAAGTVRVGWTQNAFYMGWWGLPENERRRKSLVDLVEELKPQLAAIAEKA